jgi:prepilin-type N-terminal cleavage/methylation domain-containing protein
MMKHRALTLIEVLVSVIILAVTLAGGASIYFHVMGITEQGTHRNIAVQMANSKMEVLKSMDYTTLSSESPVDVSAGGLLMRRVVTITDIGSPVEYKQVQVDMTWYESNKLQTINLTTYISP